MGKSRKFKPDITDKFRYGEEGRDPEGELFEVDPWQKISREGPRKMDIDYKLLKEPEANPRRFERARPNRQMYNGPAMRYTRMATRERDNELDRFR